MQEVGQETQDVIQAVKSYSVEQRDQAIKQTKARRQWIAILVDRHIDALESRIDQQWDEMTKASREQARESLKELRPQRVEIAEWYGGLKNSAPDAWEDIKQGFSDAYADLQQAWENAQEEFDDGHK